MNNFFSSYKNPVTLVILFIIAGGIFTYSRMQSSLFPEVTFPKIKIIAENGLQPISKMMMTVTKPLENAIKRVPDLKHVRSITSRGSCEISAFVAWDADVNLSKQQIESSINQIKNDLPPGIVITIEKMNPSILPVIGFVINGKNKSEIELNQVANNIVKPFLSQVPGVSEVHVIGGKTKEYQVELIAQKMTLLGITPAIVRSAFDQTNFINSNGYLTDYNRLYLTITDARIKNIEDLQNLIISNDGKRVLYLKDISNIKVAEHAEFIRVNSNRKSAVLIAIVKQPNINLIDLNRHVMSKIQELNQTILPKDISLTPYYVQADFVSDSIKSLSDSLWIGLLLAIIVAILFLRSFKSSAVILITIPVTLSLTIVLLYIFGYNFNIMTLGAIAASIGLIIDDAIVVTEQIHRTHEEHPETFTKDLISKAINYLFPAMVGSSVSTIVIFLPFVFLSGVAGAYFKILTNTMMITLVCSFFVTWICLPVIYMLLSGKKNLVYPRTTSIHQSKGKWISYFIHKPIYSFAFVSILIISFLFIYQKLETGFLPDMDEGCIVIDYKTPPGTSLQETDRIMCEVEKIFKDVPEIETYSRRTGTQMGFFITEPNIGDYQIQLKKNRKRTSNEIIDLLRNKIESTQPALRVDFGQVIGDMLGDLMSSTQPIEIKIYGNDQVKLKSLAKQVAGITEGVPGTADVFDGITIAGPSINIEPQNQKLAQFNISPSELQSQLQLQLQGIVVGNIYEKEQLTSIRIQYPKALQSSMTDVHEAAIFLPDGKLQPLEQLVKINIDSGSAEIERENLQSMIPVTARLDNRDLGSVIAEIKKKIQSNVSLPQGYHISYGGAYEEQQQSFGELILILISAALLVFAVMLFLFKEVKAALLIIIIATMGISGSLLALFITHTALNVGSYTGIIMIIGIIGENAVFTFLQFSQTLKTSNAEEAIVYAISTRLRPKLMTAIGAIIALTPIALGIGTGAQLHQPLAIAVIGGFIVALPLLLIVYPTMLRLLYK